MVVKSTMTPLGVVTVVMKLSAMSTQNNKSMIKSLQGITCVR